MDHANTQRLEGLIFDLDGTLTDSWPPALGAFRAAIDAYADRPYSDEELKSYAGPAEEGILRQLFPDHWNACYQRYLSEFQDRIKGTQLLFPGIAEALVHLRSNGVRLAIVSGKTKPAVDFVLEETGLIGAFDPVIGGWDGGTRKVADINEVLSYWALDPGTVAYIGDTVGDIHAAEGAGVMSLAAVWAPGIAYDNFAQVQPDEIFASTRDFFDWCARWHSDGAP